MLKIGHNQFPEFWSEFLSLDNLNPNIFLEKCTPSSCSGCTNQGYNPRSKCCTYFPSVSNFLLGSALSLCEESTKKEISRLIGSGYILPEGLIPGPGRQALAIEEYEKGLWGKSEKVICDLLRKDNATCSIHPFRNSVCSTWYCSYENEESEVSWQSLRNTISHCETAISQYSLESVGFDIDSYIKRFDLWADNIPKSFIHGTNNWSLALRRDLWGEWYGRELELILATSTWFVNNRSQLKHIAENYEIKRPRKWLDAVDQWLKSQFGSCKVEKYHKRINYKKWDDIKATSSIFK